MGLFRMAAQFSATMATSFSAEEAPCDALHWSDSRSLLAGAVIIAQQSPTPAPRDPQRELTMSVADGFTVAAVGDCIIARPVSQTPGFAAVGKLIHDADSAFGNFEGTAIDLARTPAVPQAEFGGVWIIGAPAVARDLKSIGFDIMSRANNHATDWGLEGMRQTSRALDEAGIVHAGVGEHRAAARAARFFDTDKGRVALISMASTFTPLSRSAPPVGEAPGRPGVNALRTTRYSLVTRRGAASAAEDSGRAARGLRPPAREGAGRRARAVRRSLQGGRPSRLRLYDRPGRRA